MPAISNLNINEKQILMKNSCVINFKLGFLALANSNKL